MSSNHLGPPVAQELPDKSQDVEHSGHTVAVVGGRLQPDVADSVDLFLSDIAVDFRRSHPCMGPGSPYYGHLMPQPNPLPGQVVRPILHPMFGRAGVMINQQNIHEFTFESRQAGIGPSRQAAELPGDLPTGFALAEERTGRDWLGGHQQLGVELAEILSNEAAGAYLDQLRPFRLIPQDDAGYREVMRLTLDTPRIRQDCPRPSLQQQHVQVADRWQNRRARSETFQQAQSRETLSRPRVDGEDDRQIEAGHGGHEPRQPFVAI